MSDYKEVLHKQYKSRVEAMVKDFCGNDLAVKLKIDNFSRVLAMCMWAEFGVSPQAAQIAVNEIYSTERNYTVLEIDSVIATMNDKSIMANEKIPKFFSTLAREDARRGTINSRCFAEQYQNIVVLFALIDQEVTMEEAKYITKYFDFLIDYCDREGVPAAYTSFDAYAHVTDKNDDVQTSRNLGRDNINKQPFAPQKPGNTSSPTNKNAVPTQPQNKAAAPKPAGGKEYEPGQAMEELKGLVGLENVKKEIQGIANFARIQKMRQENGLNTTVMSYHLVFTGNPGTGKTTVARLVSHIYKDLGVLSSGHLIEVDRGGLVAGYVGQTATKTAGVLDTAMGGILFIDEAYTLANEEDKGFGQEAIDTILKSMEDHRDNLVVIVAGYDNLMEKFINSNPGLKSRFTRYIHFDDYKPEQLLTMFEQNCKKNDYKLGRNVKKHLEEYFTELYENRDENFGNGRTVRTYFEQVITRQANRLATAEGEVTKEKLATITVADLGNGVE